MRPPALLASLLIVVSVLPGCAGGPPAYGAVKLARLKPLEASPADIRFAVRSPAFLKVRDGDITVTVSYDGGSDRTRFFEQYKPVVTSSPGGATGIDSSGLGGGTLTLARLAREDAESLAAFQRRVRELRAAGDEGKGSFSIAATGCREGTVPPGPIHLSGWLQTAPGDDFFPVFRDADLRAQLESVGVAAGTVPAC